MESICGAKCSECNLFKTNKCKGCKLTNGCPFGKKCFVAKYIEIGGKDNFEILKRQIIEEINALDIEGMKKVQELYPLNGSLVNLEYSLPNENKVKLLNDDEIYLGNQIECEFNDNVIKKYFGIITNMNFILVCEYGEDNINPEILIYKKR